MDNISFELIVESILRGNKNENLSEFVEKRAAGAKKIQKLTEEKGGVSKLTSIHFKAKEIPYKNCSKHINDTNSNFIEEKADECMEKLKNWNTMSQKEFQTIMGQLEAYGEVYIRLAETKK